MNEVNNPPLVTFSNGHQQLQSSPLKKAPQSLPPNVHLLTLEPIISESASRYMIRLEHFFDEGDSDEWSTPVHLDLEDFIGSLQLGGPIDWIRETTLGGNVWADETKRLEFSAEKNEINGFVFGHISATRREQTDDARLNVASVELKPFEIRTFQFQ